MTKRTPLLVFLLMISLGLYQAYFFLGTPPSSEKTYKIIDIDQGATFREVTELLHNKVLITSPVSFRLLGKITQNETKIKPGEYRLHRAMRPMEVLSILVEGAVLAHRVVIPEGMASKEIALVLENAELVDAEAFVQVVHDKAFVQEMGFEGDSLEGYLFPDTYDLNKKTSPEKIVERMVKKFEKVYEDVFSRQAASLGMTRGEVITLASIIEKETANPSERTVISAVFHNRLRRKMRLQSDPTVIFSLAKFNGNITRKDLFNKSPYNTYRVAGLPPGPISNPGKAAIYAALNPADSEYLFFVSKNNGSHYFSKTLREHNRAVQKYQLKKNDEAMCRTCGEEDG